MKNTLAKICLAIGGLLLAASISLVIYNIYEAYTADQAAQEAVSVLEEEIARNKEKEAIVPTEEPLYEEYPEMDMPVVMINGYAYVGLLEIPSIPLTLPVMQECDLTRLKISPCRYEGSAYTDDMVIAGHNYYRHFTPIKNLPIGAEVRFTDAIGNQFAYEVVSTEILNPTQVEDLIRIKDDNNWDLSLFTCTTGGAARHVVRCERK